MTESRYWQRRIGEEEKDGKTKAPTAGGRMWLVGLGFLDIPAGARCQRFSPIRQRFQCPERHPRSEGILLDWVALI